MLEILRFFRNWRSVFLGAATAAGRTASLFVHKSSYSQRGAGVRHQTATLIDFNGCQIHWVSMGIENKLTLNRARILKALAMDAGTPAGKAYVRALIYAQATGRD